MDNRTRIKELAEYGFPLTEKEYALYFLLIATNAKAWEFIKRVKQCQN